MVIVVGNGDTSSNPERDWLHFTYEWYESNYSPIIGNGMNPIIPIIPIIGNGMNPIILPPAMGK